MGSRLKGKVAIVTGSGQGIGRALAIAMAQEGAKVVTNNRKPGSTGLSSYGDEFVKKLSPADIEELRKLSGDAETTARDIIRMGGQATPFFGDVSDYKTAGKLIQTAVDKFGKVDILVNNAGAARRGFIWELSEEAWDLVMLAKVKGAFNCTRHASPLMKEQKWGRIINCTSSAWLGAKEHSNYGAANAAMVGLTRSIAKEVHKYGITCNAYAPMAITRFHINLLARIRSMAVNGHPLMTEDEILRFRDRHGPPEGMAPFIVYLATDEAAQINGTVFYSDGTGEYGIYSEPRLKKVIRKKTGVWTVDELVKTMPKTLLKGYKSKSGSAE